MSASAHQTSSSIGHETRDVRMGPIVWWGVGLVAVVAFTFVSMLVLMRYYDFRESEMSEANPLSSQYGLAQPPEPRLQKNPWKDIEQFRASEDEVLHTYGWVDKPGKVVRIPIARAMELYLQRRGAAQGTAAAR